MDKKSLAGHSPWGHKGSDTTEHTHTHQYYSNLKHREDQKPSTGDTNRELVTVPEMTPEGRC